VGEGPVLSASGDLPGLRVERDNATPAEWANIRLSLFVKNEIQRDNRQRQARQRGWWIGCMKTRLLVVYMFPAPGFPAAIAAGKTI
jgi:hypothetical protein